MAQKVRITQIKSAIGRLRNQKRTIKALGIKKMGRTVIQEDSPAIRGMISTVKHLIRVEEVLESNNA